MTRPATPNPDPATAPHPATARSSGADDRAVAITDEQRRREAFGGSPMSCLADLPEDIAEAVELLRYRIARHRLGGWQSCTPAELLAVLDMLRQHVTLPERSSPGGTRDWSSMSRRAIARST